MSQIAVKNDGEIIKSRNQIFVGDAILASRGRDFPLTAYIDDMSTSAVRAKANGKTYGLPKENGFHLYPDTETPIKKGSNRLLLCSPLYRNGINIAVHAFCGEDGNWYVQCNEGIFQIPLSNPLAAYYALDKKALAVLANTDAHIQYVFIGFEAGSVSGVYNIANPRAGGGWACNEGAAIYYAEVSAGSGASKTICYEGIYLISPSIGLVYNRVFQTRAAPDYFVKAEPVYHNLYGSISNDLAITFVFYNQSMRGNVSSGTLDSIVVFYRHDGGFTFAYKGNAFYAKSDFFNARAIPYNGSRNVLYCDFYGAASNKWLNPDAAVADNNVPELMNRGVFFVADTWWLAVGPKKSRPIIRGHYERAAVDVLDVPEIYPTAWEAVYSVRIIAMNPNFCVICTSPTEFTRSFYFITKTGMKVFQTLDRHLNGLCEQYVSASADGDSGSSDSEEHSSTLRACPTADNVFLYSKQNTAVGKYRYTWALLNKDGIAYPDPDAYSMDIDGVAQNTIVYAKNGKYYLSYKIPYRKRISSDTYSGGAD